MICTDEEEAREHKAYNSYKWPRSREPEPREGIETGGRARDIASGARERPSTERLMPSTRFEGPRAHIEHFWITQLDTGDMGEVQYTGGLGDACPEEEEEGRALPRLSTSSRPTATSSLAVTDPTSTSKRMLLYHAHFAV